MTKYEFGVYHQPKPKVRRKPIILAIAAVCAALALAVSGFILWRTVFEKPAKQTSNSSQTPVEEKPAGPTYTEANGRYLMNGTIVIARAVEKWSRLADGSYDYKRPFSGLHTFQPELYDNWIADFECPSLDIVIPYQVQVDLLQFNCRPEFMAEAAKYFDVLDLANNHSGDRGRDGFEETRNRLIAQGFQPHGHYDPSIKKDICEVVGLDIRLKKSEDGTEDKAVMPVAFCAWHYFGRMPEAGEVEHMTQYSKIMPVFAFVHMGTEYLTSANAYQVDIAHRVIDAGADFVIGNNPHWVQNSEVYKGKLIFYSTGNFIFDQIDSEGMRSASVDVTMNVKYDENVASWLALGESCKKLHDDCFEQAKAKNLIRPSFTLKYGVIAGDNSGKLTKKGSPALQQAIEQRTNWTQTIQQLGQ